MPSAESLIWAKLRGRRDDGLKFRRQHPVPPHVLDFAERNSKLCIEIDGATHGTDIELAKDAKRTAALENKGWTVIRLTNVDVYESLDRAVDHILYTAYDLERLGPPSTSLRSPTSPRKRGEE